ncbi:MAG: carbohydrate ABC transporter permease [Clostridiales bacterium]|nr:carbohydrate ABC transporter permease [Clostridiales bacterium]
MSPRRLNLLILEILTIILFIVFMMPFLMVVLNSAKDAKEIIADPIGLPTNWGTLLLNVKTIVTSPNINYIPSFISSVIITTLSLGLIALTAAMGGWVLVRSKSKLSTFIFMMFVAAMVIPFQVVMFPLVAFFRMIREATGIPLLQTYQGMILAYIGFGSSLSIFMFHGFIKGIPLELEEAATIDGCTRPQIFFQIVLSDFEIRFRLPFVILNGIWVWNDYLLPLLILGTGGDIQTLPLAVANFVGSYVKKMGSDLDLDHDGHVACYRSLHLCSETNCPRHG